MKSRIAIFGLFSLLILLNSGFGAAINITPENREYVESRIYNTTNTYVINYTEDGNEYTVRDNGYYGLRKVFNSTFWLVEIDPHYAQVIRVIENDDNGQFITLGLTLIENPNDPYPNNNVPLRACVNATKIQNANRFEVPNTFCREGTTQYELGNLLFNREYTVRFNEHPTPYMWWLGEEDPDGTYGQGGIGDGLPTCDGMYASIRLNGSTTANAVMLVGQETQMSMKANWFGSSQYGCSVTSLENQNYNLLPAWKIIPTLTQTNSRLNCTGAICSRSSPAWNVWYNKQVTCDKVGNVSVRVAIFGTAPSKANSPTRNIECRETPTEEEIAEVVLPPKSKERFNPLWLSTFGLMAFTAIILKKKNTPPPEE